MVDTWMKASNDVTQALRKALLFNGPLTQRARVGIQHSSLPGDDLPADLRGRIADLRKHILNSQEMTADEGRAALDELLEVYVELNERIVSHFQNKDD